MNWDINKIRSTFLEYFQKKGHKIVPSAPMVVKDDPTLMFTNAGMNQFKDFFLGNTEPKYPMVANSQKCLRVSGKHNDLEEVGVDTYHHTMFEMLGNWSFGDYFKQEAIEMAWELLTKVYQLPEDRLYVTVFGGDKEDGTASDYEAEQYWLNWVSKDRILHCNKKDNFWEMGEMGPCGPSSEIHIDLRPDEERNKVDGKELVNMDHPLVIEIWNLVFIQFNRDAKGELSKLPKQHIDTGMGLERLAMALQLKQSNYDTDVFVKLIERIKSLSGKDYGYSDSKSDIAFRVIADHIRAVSFAIADGQLPSNNGAGYVIRRILRRAVRYGYSFLEMNKPFMFELVGVLAAEMGNHFTELSAQSELIEKVVKEEEEAFLRTLSKGISRLNKLLEENSDLSGKSAFELYDTFGFPIDLTILIASERKANVDLVGFEQELEAQKNRSRSSNVIETDDWIVIHPDLNVEFIGYDELEVTSSIIKYRQVNQKGKSFYQIVLGKTPFYPEGGGQVGDKGVLIQGTDSITVFDTKKENDLIILFANKLPEKPTDDVTAIVDAGKRKASQANHSATHLLHYVLRDVLGTHVEQKGSLVSSEYLRFDFSHFQKVSEEELNTIEERINRLIEEDLLLNEFRSIPIDEAKQRGAMMLFGEKYGEKVRMIQFGDSIELCGGTHVSSLARIRAFRIQSESSIASGVRRIEAITGNKVFEYYQGEERVLNKVKGLLQNDKNPLKALEGTIDRLRKVEEQLEEVNRSSAKAFKQSLLSNLETISDGVQYKFETTTLENNYVKDMLFEIKREHANVLVGVANTNGGKLTLSLLVGEELIDRGLSAKDGIKLIAPIIKGGGGGQPFFATAGGKNVNAVNEAFKALEEWITSVN